MKICLVCLVIDSLFVEMKRNLNKELCMKHFLQQEQQFLA